MREERERAQHQPGHGDAGDGSGGREAGGNERAVPEEQKRRQERKFFPGYVLVNMDMRDETWHLVKETPRVMGFIGEDPKNPGHVSPISEKEANAILQRMDDSTEKPKPKTLFEAGEVVRVIDGPFADFNGVVEEVNYEKNRLQVAVLIFGRSTPVELEFSQVEKS